MKGIYGKKKKGSPQTTVYNKDLIVFRSAMKFEFELMTKQEVDVLEPKGHRVMRSDVGKTKDGREFDQFIRTIRFDVLNPFSIMSDQYDGVRLDSLVFYPPKDARKTLYPALRKEDGRFVINEDFSPQPLFDRTQPLDNAIMTEIEKITDYFDGRSKMSMALKLPIVSVRCRYVEKQMHFEDGDAVRNEFRVYSPYTGFKVTGKYADYNRPTKIKPGASANFVETYTELLRKCQEADKKKARA